jgi:rubrerythrin
MEKEELFKLFKIMIDREQEAYETYKGLAEKFNDDNLKKMFEDMANDELRHIEQIMEQYNILRE